jgi:hypothetical protein
VKLKKAGNWSAWQSGIVLLLKLSGEATLNRLGELGNYINEKY